MNYEIGTCSSSKALLVPMLLVGLFALASTHVSTAENVSSSGVEETNVFISGKGGYHTYRIPAIVCTEQGALLAFCEGRKESSSDAGDIDLLVRRSTDNGKTWSATQVVWDDGANTCGNPCPVVDTDTSRIWLPCTWNAGVVHEAGIATGLGTDSRRVFMTSSNDDGKTWDDPREITSSVKDKSWAWYATGPGAAIQIKNGKHRGRLIVPCDHSTPSKVPAGYFSHVIYSDDHGKTWTLGGTTPNGKENECEIVELTDGRLMLNIRNHDRSVRNRQVAYSDDGGQTWVDQRRDKALIEPICQASIRRYAWSGPDGTGIILFSNPASKTHRKNMTIRASLDDGDSWPYSRQLYSGDSAYSCLVVLPNGKIGCLHEADGYERIAFASFTYDWLTNNP